MSENWLITVGYRDSDHPGTSHARGAEFLLAGHNVFGTEWYSGAIDGIFGQHAGDAARRAKFELGYPLSAVAPTFGPLLKDYLTGAKKRSPAMLLRARSRAKKFIRPTDPKGTVIGFPGVGTHSFVVPPNNWESDNAWDIAVPAGSKALAVADGTIGPEFGPLPDPDPRFHGIRLHLEIPGNEFYYAHLRSTFPGIGPGVKVKQGDILGATGIANGVEHLHIGVEHLINLKDL